MWAGRQGPHLFLHPLGGTDAVAPFHTTCLDVQKNVATKNLAWKALQTMRAGMPLRGAAITIDTSSKPVPPPARFLKWGTNNRKGVPWLPQEGHWEGQAMPWMHALSPVLKLWEMSSSFDHLCSYFMNCWTT